MMEEDVDMQGNHSASLSDGVDPGDNEEHATALSRALIKEEDQPDCGLFDDGAVRTTHGNGSLAHQEAKQLDNGQTEPLAQSGLHPSSSDVNPKKRKRPDTPSSRAVSPPWKLPTAEGPTTFTQEGKRRSARTNELPIDLKPGADERRHTRAEHHRAQEKQDARKPISNNAGTTSPATSRSTRGAATNGTFKAPAPKQQSQAHPQTQPQMHIRQTRRTSEVEEQSSVSTRARRNSQVTYGKRDRQTNIPSSPEVSHRRVKSGHLVKHLANPVNREAKQPAISDVPSTSPSSGFKLKLRGLREANREPPRTLNPLHTLQSDKVKHTSFAEFIQQDNVWDGEEDGPMTGKQAARTARSINRLVEESRPGGLLSEERSIMLSQPHKAEEPPHVYGHWQHVVAQALNFRQLLVREVRQHQESARKTANAASFALDGDRRFAKLKPKISREEWEAHQFAHQKKRYQQIVRDVQGSWGMVRKEVLKVLEKEQDAKRQTEGRKALDSMLDQSTSLLNQRRGRTSMSLASDDEDDAEYGSSATPMSRDVSTSRGPSRMSIVSTPALVGSDESAESDAVSDSENMSSSGDEDEEADENPDAILSIEELRAKYGDLPEQEPEPFTDEDEHDDMESPEQEMTNQEPGDDLQSFDESHEARSHREGSIDPADIALDDVDSALEEDEDQSSGSETEPESDEDENEATGDDEDGSGAEEEDEMGGLLGFFGKGTATKLKAEQARTIMHTAYAGSNTLDVVTDDAVMDTIASAAVGVVEPVADPSTDEWPATRDGVVAEDHPSLDTTGTRVDSSVDIVSETDKLADTVGVADGVPTPAATSVGDADTPSAEVVGADGSTSAETGDDSILPLKDSIMETDATSRSETPKALVARPASPFSASRPLTPKSGHSGQIDVSLLLRGTLREYQQNGLDWLAGLYLTGSNGILADEMGLGKTIQTIALFAHLAIHKKEWGPHLVVVPTSVMLNWEMEFKKFLPGFKVLTYYGSIAERKKLRFGWLNDDKWNVVITSYQLVVQDKQAFKKRRWHYLVLDEAHQIKNWQTQKWQSMLNMNTVARLLLTGTPLQNNLSELWSLFFFLMPGEGSGGQGFAELEQFQQAMKRPADQILNQGKQVLDEQARKQVTKLHEVLRPYLLRRLKADVEKQMPGKYEHVVYCKLSKRQRQLYDAFLGRADTRATLLGGNYVGVMHVLMELRKVCNHPDLFEERMVRTSFSMPRSPVRAYEPVDILIRKRLLAEEDARLNLEHLGLNVVHKESIAKQIVWRAEYLRADRPMADLVERATRKLTNDGPFSGGTVRSTQAFADRHLKAEALEQLNACQQTNLGRTSIVQRPAYGISMRQLLTVDRNAHPFSRQAMVRTFDKRDQALYFRDFAMNKTNFKISDLQMTFQRRADDMLDLVQKFSIATPNVVAHDLVELTLGQHGMLAAEVARARHLREQTVSPTLAMSGKLQPTHRQGVGIETRPDPFHETRIRQTIAFPDKRLLQYDCGKLQKLATLLRDLQAGGHRALIFTQMSRVLDILEIFLNFHGYRYLRLDGTTKVEHRQLLTEKYNSDPRILVFILSSRSGGLGINLTGADSVIFYDLDWNPAMDKQCQDRAHRIGQTRDVHIYKFVSEYTIEANILKKSNQKRLLDDVIIQKGEFTTDYFNRVTHKDALEGVLEDNEASKAMDMVLGDERQIDTALQSVEDKDDATAAKAAAKEAHDVEAEDEKEMEDEDSTGIDNKAGENPQGEKGHVDDYMFQSMYKDLAPQAEMLFKVKARDKVAARRARDRHRVR